MTDKIEQLPDGIYFGLPFRDYLAQDRRSGGQVTTLLKGSLVYYEDFIAPTLEPGYDPDMAIDDATESAIEGQAWHKMVLEGQDEFDKEFAPAFEPEKHEGALITGDDMRKALAARGLNQSGGNKAMKHRIQKFDEFYCGPREKPPAAIFIDDVRAEFEQQHDGKHFLSAKQREEIDRAGKIIDQYGIREAWLFGGHPEVTILFTVKVRDTEIKCKIRVDYLRPDMQIEYKTIANANDKLLDRACRDQVDYYGYLTTAFMYRLGVETARKHLRDEANGAEFVVQYPADYALDWDFIERLKAGDPDGAHEYWFLFQQRGKYNHCLMRSIPQYDTRNRAFTSMHRTGQIRFKRAIATYQWHMENHGLETRWLPDLNAKGFDDDDFTMYMLEE